MMKFLIRILAAFFPAVVSAQAASLALSAEDIRGPRFNINGIRITLTGAPPSLSLGMKLTEVAIQGKTWHNLHFSCDRFHAARDAIRCDKGALRLAESTPLPVTFRLSAPGRTSDVKTLDVRIRNSAGKTGEGWKLLLRTGRAGWEGTLTAANGEVARIVQLLPVSENAILPSSTKGKISGAAKLRADLDGPADIDAHLAVEGVAFSDASGLHAGENISITVDAEARRTLRRIPGQKAHGWEWQADAHWPQGEVFWQPLYFAARGDRFSARGELDDNILHLRTGKLSLAEIGEIDLSGSMDWSARTLHDLDLDAPDLQMAGLYSQIVKPFLVNTSFSALKTAGQAGVKWRFRNGVSEMLDVDLRGISLEDEGGRFALHDINARIPLRATALTHAAITIRGGHISRLPVGPVHIPLEITGLNEPGFRIPRMEAPLMDGRLTLENFSAIRQGQAQGSPPGWRWQFSGDLSPISMEQLTRALGIQPMNGTLSGKIPRVTFDGSAIEVQGALLFNVFDGTVLVWNLKALEPFGSAPSLMADVDMRNLDLDLLTGAFSFGNMEGRMDVVVRDLELFDWKPVKFNARLMSSRGDYRRRISQRAVQSISSLGGVGAAAAIQRSFLRVFDEFGYSQIGWSCRLRNGVCDMGGIESEPLPHGYLIVKGGGIPAITVIGYNRRVDWQELISRLQRITDANARPVLQQDRQ
ncbi:MAG: hypothetical protein J0H48_02685 [Nitrosospira multiformis]|nr:hypothetical protein [Nitrosospira multiformis]